MRRSGRRRHDRLRAMRFALWAQDKPPSEITPQVISSLLDISLISAREWRTDWFKTLSPIELENVPPPPGVRLPDTGNHKGI
ncbi:MAG: hypothetical protein WA956_05745 [Stenotrophomonas sp.]